MSEEEKNHAIKRIEEVMKNNQDIDRSNEEVLKM